MNKFIFDMWPFLDKVLSTFIWHIWYKFIVCSAVEILNGSMISQSNALLLHRTQAICNNIKRVTRPIFDQYVGKYGIESIEFEELTLGALPPTFQGP